MQSPSRINAIIARLTADQLVLDAFFAPMVTPQNVSGSGLLYDVLLSGGNFTATDVAQRNPGAPTTLSMDKPRDLAVSNDFGEKMQILDEIDRYDVSVLRSQFVAQQTRSATRSTSRHSHGMAVVDKAQYDELRAAADAGAKAEAQADRDIDALFGRAE